MPDDRPHIPVMLKEVLEYLIPGNGRCRVVDGTLGFGGHSAEILKRNPEAELIGIDRDEEALSYSRKILEFAGNRAKLVKGCFGDIDRIVRENGWQNVDAILLDIGVSSWQIDEPSRGFTFRKNGPLDMRMDGRSRRTAAQILNQSSREELIAIFENYGEVDKAWKLADAIIGRRAERPLATTAEFAELCEKVLHVQRRGGPPVPTLCFQALRIAVNDELGELERALKASAALLSSGGRIGVISYHSLEDRIVKNYFRDESTDCHCPPGLPVCRCGHKAVFSLVTRKPLIPLEDETSKNPRASSAKMRVAEKL